MVGKFGPSDVFTAIEKKEHENSYHLNVIDEFSNNETEVAIELLNIVRTFQTTALVTSMSNCPSSPMSYYYVEMSHSFATPTNNHEKDQLEDVIPNLNNLISPNQTQRPIGLVNLLSLLILPTKRIQSNEPLVDYSNSHGHIKPIFDNFETKGNGQKNCQ